MKGVKVLYVMFHDLCLYAKSFLLYAMQCYMSYGLTLSKPRERYRKGHLYIQILISLKISRISILRRLMQH